MIGKQKGCEICSQRDMQAKKVKLKIKSDMVKKICKKIPNLKVMGYKVTG